MFHTNEIIPIGLRRPPPGQEVIAVTTRGRRSAVRDAQGNWSSWIGQEELDGEVIGWIEIARLPDLFAHGLYPGLMGPARADG